MSAAVLSFLLGVLVTLLAARIYRAREMQQRDGEFVAMLRQVLRRE